MSRYERRGKFLPFIVVMGSVFGSGAKWMSHGLISVAYNPVPNCDWQDNLDSTGIGPQKPSIDIEV